LTTPAKPKLFTIRYRCPECQGDLKLRNNKARGKEFLGCANYKSKGCKWTGPYQTFDQALLADNMTLNRVNSELEGRITELEEQLAGPSTCSSLPTALHHPGRADRRVQSLPEHEPSVVSVSAGTVPGPTEGGGQSLDALSVERTEEDEEDIYDAVLAYREAHPEQELTGTEIPQPTYDLSGQVPPGGGLAALPVEYEGSLDSLHEELCGGEDSQADRDRGK